MRKIFALSCVLPVLLLCRTEAAITADIFPEAARQGKTFTVTVSSELPLRSVSADFLGKNIPFYSAEAGFRGIIGIHPSTRPDNYPMSIIATDEAGLTEISEIEVPVRASRFLAEKLAFPPGKNEKLSSRKIQKDQAKVGEVMEIETQEQLWSGKFIKPIKGYITSPYGSYRLYNGKHLADHRGTDIGGNPVGAPIKAANSGKVAFTEFLPTIGSTIILDHGQGINSIYMHMSKTLVKAGDMIKKGQVIGRIGSTGLSNGPHLHWGISVHNVRVDPLEWSARTIAK